MPTLVIYQLNADPWFNNNVSVTNSFTVDIVDDDPTIEDPDTGVQLDVSGIPGFVGNSSNFQVFETYSGDVGATPVTFTLVQFDGGNVYMYLTEGAVSVGQTITGTGFTATGASPSNYDDLPDFVCFTAGSHIQTPTGPKLIETIVAGDLVVVANGDPKPVKWVAKRKMSAETLALKRHLKPVVIRPNALGNGCPKRTIRVSQQHRIAFSCAMSELLFESEHVLVPARFLTNRDGIFIDNEKEDVEYIHLLFDQHELVNVEGLWSESFFIGDTVIDAQSKSIQTEVLEIFPELRGNLSAYGKTNMTVLKTHEVRVVRDQLQAYRPL